MFEDDEFDAWDDEPEEPFEPEPQALDPADDEEAQPAPGDFWFEPDEIGDG